MWGELFHRIIKKECGWASAEQQTGLRHCGPLLFTCHFLSIRVCFLLSHLDCPFLCSPLAFHLSCSPWAPDYILTLAQSPLLASWNCSSRRAQLDLPRVLWTDQLLLRMDNCACLCPFSSVLRLLLWRVHFSFVLNSFFVPHFGLESLQNCVLRTFLSFFNIIIISLKLYCLGFILPDEIQNEHVRFHYISHVFLWE